jgi:hypothetical protein
LSDHLHRRFPWSSAVGDYVHLASPLLVWSPSSPISMVRRLVGFLRGYIMESSTTMVTTTIRRL